MPSPTVFVAASGSIPAVTVTIDGRSVRVPEGASVAAALLAAGLLAARMSPVDGSPRGPYCLMGVCHECLLVVDDGPPVRGCLVAARDGMRIRLVS